MSLHLFILKINLLRNRRMSKFLNNNFHLKSQWKHATSVDGVDYYSHLHSLDECEGHYLQLVSMKQIDQLSSRELYSYAHCPKVYKCSISSNNFKENQMVFNIHLLIESVPFRLDRDYNSNQFQFADRRNIIEIAKGFNYLFKRYGAFKPSERMIGWTKEGDIKVWFNQEYTSCKINHKLQNEKQMVNYVYEILKKYELTCKVVGKQINGFSDLFEYLQKSRKRKTLVSFRQDRKIIDEEKKQEKQSVDILSAGKNTQKYQIQNISQDKNQQRNEKEENYNLEQINIKDENQRIWSILKQVKNQPQQQYQLKRGVVKRPKSSGAQERTCNQFIKKENHNIPDKNKEITRSKNRAMTVIQFGQFPRSSLFNENIYSPKAVKNVNKTMACKLKSFFSLNQEISQKSFEKQDNFSKTWSKNKFEQCVVPEETKSMQDEIDQLFRSNNEIQHFDEEELQNELDSILS